MGFLSQVSARQEVREHRSVYSIIAAVSGCVYSQTRLTAALLNLMRGGKKSGKKKVLRLYLGFVSSGGYLRAARRSPRDANR